MVAQESTTQKDEEIIVSIVKEMTESMTGAQSTRHWAEDALWFDIPPFASRGHSSEMVKPSTRTRVIFMPSFRLTPNVRRDP
jgi:CheY-specific phosphatase CheX